MKSTYPICVCMALSLVNSVAAGPLAVSQNNKRYFTDGSGKAVLLSGAHTWRNFQAIGNTVPPADDFDFSKYLSYLASENLNFLRLWSWESSRDPAGRLGHAVSPLPFARSGPGVAQDGLPRFDLSALNKLYFDRLRQYVDAAGNRGFYVGVLLFNGWSVGKKNGENPWRFHPFYCPSAPSVSNCNNIQGINGDINGDGNGYEVHTLANAAITAVQEAYVRKVIETLNDLDNVLYEIANETEAGGSYVAWQNYFIDYIHDYEAAFPKQHPVGFSVPYPNGNNAPLFASHAEYVSPNDVGGYKDNPPAADGSKVIVSDTDHLWGLGGDRYWAWKSFSRGLNLSYMDCYQEDASGGCPIAFRDPARVSLVANLGYIRRYADKMNLVAMVPSGSLASTGFALASATELLVYAPAGGTFSVNLGGIPGNVLVEWFIPQTGVTLSGNSIVGGKAESFTPPFTGDAVLYLRGVEARLAAPGNLRVIQ